MQRQGTYALDVLVEVGTSRRLLAPAADDDARAAHDLHGLAIGVVLAQTSPLAEDLAIIDVDERDVVLLQRRRLRIQHHVRRARALRCNTLHRAVISLL
jgi:hypothetical protein